MFSHLCSSLKGKLSACMPHLLVGALFFAPVAHASDSTGVTPGDGPLCTLNVPSPVSFNTVLQPSLTLTLTSTCTRYPILWEWTASPLDYTSRTLTGQNTLFAPLFTSGALTWTSDNRKVSTTNQINITFSSTGTFTFATRGKDADYIPPNNTPAGFWGPWGAPGSTSIDTSGAWKNIVLTCEPYTETQVLGPGGALVCSGGRVSSNSQSRTFCSDSTTPTWGPWVPSTSCECPSGTVWNGASCVAVPTCTVTPTPPLASPGQNVLWNVSCNTPPTSVVWTSTTPNNGVCTGTTCSQQYPTPTTACFTVQGSNTAGAGPVSSPGCVVVACPPGQTWSAGASACGAPPTITSPSFSVHTPQLATIPITVTGTQPRTCSATTLPAGYVMSPSCVISSVQPGIDTPPVPSTCSVTVTNPWGSDTKPCSSLTVAAPSCSVSWSNMPLALGNLAFAYPTSRDYNTGPEFSSTPILFQDPGKKTLAAATGSAGLNIRTANADTYSVSCSGAPTITGATAIDPMTGIASAQINYVKQYPLSALSYSAGIWNNNTGSYSFDAVWITGDQGNGGFWLWPPINYTQTAQVAIDPPGSSVCTVTAKSSATGQTTQCTSEQAPIVVKGQQSYCTLDVSMVEWLYRTSTNAVTPVLPSDQTTVTGNTTSPTPRILNSPNTLFLDARLNAPGIELSSAGYIPPYSTPYSSGAPFQNPAISCKKRVIKASQPTPPWGAQFNVPLTQSVSFTKITTPFTSDGGSQARTIVPGAVQFGYAGWPFNLAPTSFGDTVDSINEEYDISCEYTGSGYNVLTGAPESVSCAGWYTYAPGAVCVPQASFAAGPVGTNYGTSVSYSGYVAGWEGPMKFVGEKVTLAGNLGTGGRGTFFSAPSFPKLNQFGIGDPNVSHVVVNRLTTDTWNWGSTHSWLHDFLPHYTDANILRSGDVIATAPLGGAGLLNTPSLMRGCSGSGFGSGYNPCGHATVINVERTLFPGTAAQRLSTAACTLTVGSATSVNSNPCTSNCTTGPGVPFGPGAGNGSGTGSNGPGDNSSGPGPGGG